MSTSIVHVPVARCCRPLWCTLTGPLVLPYSLHKPRSQCPRAVFLPWRVHRGGCDCCGRSVALQHLSADHSAGALLCGVRSLGLFVPFGLAKREAAFHRLRSFLCLLRKSIPLRLDLCQSRAHVYVCTPNKLWPARKPALRRRDAPIFVGSPPSPLFLSVARRRKCLSPVGPVSRQTTAAVAACPTGRKPLHFVVPRIPAGLWVCPRPPPPAVLSSWAASGGRPSSAGARSLTLALAAF